MRKLKLNDQLEVPMSSMIDVVFLLLIFFIVTYHEEVIETNLAIDRPAATTAITEAPIQLIEIQVHPGYYQFRDGRATSLEDVIDQLALFIKYDPDQTAIIKVSKNAKHEELIRLLDHCNRIGLTKFNIVSLKA